MIGNEIVIRRENIPIKQDDLRRFILIGKRVIEAHKAKLKAIVEVGTAAAAHQAALEDAQTVAEVVLDAESKLGEMLAGLPKPKLNESINGSVRRTIGKHRGSLGGTTITTLPTGIDKKMSHEAQQIHKLAKAIA